MFDWMECPSSKCLKLTRTIDYDVRPGSIEAESQSIHTAGCQVEGFFQKQPFDASRVLREHGQGAQEIAVAKPTLIQISNAREPSIDILTLCDVLG